MTTGRINQVTYYMNGAAPALQAFYSLHAQPPHAIQRLRGAKEGFTVFTISYDCSKAIPTDN